MEKAGNLLNSLPPALGRNKKNVFWKRQYGVGAERKLKDSISTSGYNFWAPHFWTQTDNRSGAGYTTAGEPTLAHLSESPF